MRTEHLAGKTQNTDNSSEKTDGEQPSLQKPTIIVVEAAILIEAQWYDVFDEIWLLTVGGDLEIATARLMARNKFSKEEALKRVAATNKISSEEKAKYADVVFKNDGTEKDLKVKV